MAKKNSKAILSKTFDFDPEEYLDKYLLFDLEKISEEKHFDSVLEKYRTMTRITLKIVKVPMFLE